MRTDDGLPATTLDGSVPSATVNVSSTSSASWFVLIVPVPLVAPEVIAMLVSVPWSSGSAELSVIVSGIVTALDSAPDSVAVTVTLDPSATGFGDADSRTSGTAAAASGVPLASSQKPGPMAFTARTRTR